MSFTILIAIIATIAVMGGVSTLLIQRSNKQKAAARDKVAEADRKYFKYYKAGVVAELASALTRVDKAGRRAFERITDDGWYNFWVLDEARTSSFKIKKESKLGKILKAALSNYKVDAGLHQDIEEHLEQLRVLRDASAADDARLEAGIPLLRISFHKTSGKRGRMFLVHFLGATADEVRGTFNQVAEARLHHLIETLRHGGEQHYGLVYQHRLRMGDWAREWGTQKITLPEDWNQLVADKVAVPKLSDFIGLRHYEDMPTGTVALMAAEALRQGNQLLGKIVLAYVNSMSGEHARAEVPDGLLTEVVKMVERKNAEARTPQSAG